MSLSMDAIPPQFLDAELAIEQIGDAQALHGMLSMLEESLARDIPLIHDLLVAEDVRGANRTLHALKGFIPIFCVESMCLHVAKVEELSKKGSASEVLLAYLGLMPDLELLQLEVVDYLNSHGGA